MKKKFSKSWSFRKDALFSEIGSRDYELYHNNRLSKIDSDQRFWLVIFTKSSKNDFEENKPGEWYVRFWIWDSEENKIQGEEILTYSFKPDKTEENRYVWTNSSLSECYLNYEYERIVIRPKWSKMYLIYDFTGTLLFQTETGDSHTNKEEEQYYSTFLTKNLFFAKNDGRLILYQLDKLENLKPNSMFFFGLTKVNFWQAFNGYDYVKFYYDEDLTYFVFLAWEYSAEGAADRSMLFIYKIDSDKETAKFICKFMFEDSIGDVEINSTTLGMDISFHHWKDHKLSEEKTEIHLPKCLF
jgi:hypothetical protein